MNNIVKFSIVIIGIFVSVVFYNNYNTSMNIAANLEHQKRVSAQLKSNVDLLNKENSVLNGFLTNQTQKKSMTETSLNSQEKIINIKTSKTKHEMDNNSVASDTNLVGDHRADDVQQNTIDINAPFNGVDPASNEQQQKYAEFRAEIENYQFNERFDMRSFMSDSRFSELHASLGVKLINYVDTQLQDVALMQDNPEGAAMLTELDH